MFNPWEVFGKHDFHPNGLVVRKGLLQFYDSTTLCTGSGFSVVKNMINHTCVRQFGFQCIISEFLGDIDLQILPGRSKPWTARNLLLEESPWRTNLCGIHGGERGFSRRTCLRSRIRSTPSGVRGTAWARSWSTCWVSTPKIWRRRRLIATRNSG